MQNNQNSSITYYRIKKELQEKLAKKENSYLTEQNKMEYKDTLASYYSKAEFIYDNEYNQEKVSNPFKNKIIAGQEATLEADELASIFLPFYERDNWEYPDKKFLSKHKKTFHRFLELQKYNP